MVYREFDCAKIYASFADYGDWRTAAQTATDALCHWHTLNPPTGGAKPPIDAKLYGKLKPFLAAYFDGKCAYCDSDFEVVDFGDVEHYRPKRGVTEDPAHRGYYWLAYDESNLLPSCKKCNAGTGKRNRFPIAGQRAAKPNDTLDLENPLLLNPFVAAHAKEFDRHLEYDFLEMDGRLEPTGVIRGKTDEGKMSVEVYDWNRRQLTAARAWAQAQAIKAVSSLLGRTAELKAEIDSQADPRRPYATAVRAACLRWIDYQTRLVRRELGLP